MKKFKKLRLFVLYPLLGVLILIVTLVLYKLSQSNVILTENGMYTTLQVPIKSKFIDVNISLSGGADNPNFHTNFIEGPIVTYESDEKISVDWFSNGGVHHKEYDANIKNFSIDHGVQKLSFVLPEITKPIIKIPFTPEKIAFISDIHGDYEYMDTALKELKIIDSIGNWNFYDNHLVIAGDMVDRGNEASSVLWKIVQLSKQAEEAGGMIHYLIGNHEQYILKGNFSRVEPSNLYAIQQMMSFKDAFSDQTYLGKWLRSRPVVIKIGKTIITHGGISLNTAKKGYSIEQLNQGMWDYWDNKKVKDPLKEAILGRTGITQYRGYFYQNGDIQKASTDDVKSVLSTYTADHIIVGHTNVSSIKPFYNGKIYNINAIETSPEVLLFKKGIPEIVDIGIIKKENIKQKHLREFSFSKGNDWKMLMLTISSFVKLSRISHPY